MTSVRALWRISPTKKPCPKTGLLYQATVKSMNSERLTFRIVVKKRRCVLVIPRKEVIQPQVPLRLPCYDLVPVIWLTVDRRLLAVDNPVSGTPDSHDLTGGVYKAQEHIHRDVADSRLLAIPTSCRRVVSLQSELGRLFCDLLCLAALHRFVLAIVARVRPWA